MDVQAPAEASSAASSVQGDRIRRILREMRNLMQKPHPAFDVYPCTQDVTFWRLVMEGTQSVLFANESLDCDKAISATI